MSETWCLQVSFEAKPWQTIYCLFCSSGERYPLLLGSEGEPEREGVQEVKNVEEEKIEE